MKLEIDPDVWLASRLSLGRGWPFVLRMAVHLAGLTWLIAGAGSSHSRPFRDLNVVFGHEIWPATGDPILTASAISLLMLAPGTLLHLAELEGRDQLDGLRIAGRRPSRVLAAFLAGSAWPFAASFVLLAGVSAIRDGFDGHVIAVALLLAVMQLDATLLAYQWLGRMATLPASIFALVAFGTALFRGWIAGNPAAWTEQIVTALAAFAALPLAVRGACRRLERSAVNPERRSMSPGALFARLVPRAGPPEFLRALRSSLFQYGDFLTIFNALFLTLLGSVAYGLSHDWSRTTLLSLIIPIASAPWLLVLFGSFAMAIAGRFAMDTRAIELVRLTPQRPEAIAAGLYFGVILPFALGAIACAAVLRFLPDLLPAFQIRWWRSPELWAALIAALGFLSALALVEPFQRRAPLTCFLYAGLAGYSALSVTGQPMTPDFRRSHPVASEVADVTGRVPLLAGDADATGSIVLMLLLASAVAIGAVAGRVRRPEGPSLVGAAAAASIAAVVWSLRVLPADAYPAIVIAFVTLLAPLLADDRRPLAPPWRRVAWLASVAFAATAVAAAYTVGLSAGAALATAAASAIAVATATVGFELLSPWTIAAFALPLVMLEAMLRSARPPILALAIAFTAIAVVHRLVRTADAAP